MLDSLLPMPFSLISSTSARAIDAFLLSSFCQPLRTASPNYYVAIISYCSSIPIMLLPPFHRFSIFVYLVSAVAAAGGLATAQQNVVSCDPCIERSKVRIGCVHHGLPTKDVYWQFMDSAIAQGAKDMGIDLLYDPIYDFTLEEEEESSIEDYMSEKIQQLCSDGLNGIFVSLPSPSIIDALNTCKEANIPAVVFNAGIDAAEANGYLFIGQDEQQAGFEAGAGLAAIDGVDTFCCINHAPGVGVLKDRCGGFGAGLEANGVSVGYADVHVNPNNCTQWEDAVVKNCSPLQGNWSSVGLYFAGQANHKCGVQFLREHPGTYADANIAASDVSDDLYTGMNDGLNIIFGIDQQTYLQGYFPNSFLTLASTNNQIVQNENIETGPRLVKEPPPEHYQQCKANGYVVCDSGSSSNGDGGESVVSTANTDATSRETSASSCKSQLGFAFLFYFHLFMACFGINYI